MIRRGVLSGYRCWHDKVASVTNRLAIRQMQSRWRLVVSAIDTWLPRGVVLPERSWLKRHRGICMLLWVHVVLIFVIAVARQMTVAHAMFEAAIVAAFAAGAQLRWLGLKIRSALATLGLLSSSAVLLHLFDGITEMHFHFFVMISVIALYQSWVPFLLSLSFVVLHHGILGYVAPYTVFGSHPATDTPWMWTMIHGGFIFGQSVACLMYWRITEDALDGERAARVAHGDLAQAQELSAMGSWAWDITSNTVTWSDQLYVLAAVDPTTFTPSIDAFLELTHPDDRAEVAGLLSAAAEVGAELDYECRLVGPDGKTRTIHALGECVAGTVGTAKRMFGTIHDVTKERRLQDEIEYLAFHDPLTGLANRRLFLDRLGHALAVTERSGRSCAVLFMDLDDFKKVNDTFGHHVGDELLCVVARRLTDVGRSADTIARFGGDEFALLCEGIDIEMAIRVVERIEEQLQRPVELQNIEVHIGASIGIALAEGSRSTEDILREADAAMYAVKSAGNEAVRNSA